MHRYRTLINRIISLDNNIHFTGTRCSVKEIIDCILGGAGCCMFLIAQENRYYKIVCVISCSYFSAAEKAGDMYMCKFSTSTKFHNFKFFAVSLQFYAVVIFVIVST